MAFDDIYTAGIASGWKVTDASTLQKNQTLEADVVIVGTGAGGGTTAEILSQAGLKVLMIEEGALKTSANFKDLDESRAYRELYQEGAGRASSDGAIAILQGRAVGGTTVVNWTASFRTPDHTLKHWADVHQVKGHSPEDMKPWFEKVANEMNEVDGTKLYLFNIEQDKDFAVNELGIRSVPTIKGFSGGKEVYHSTGVLREEQIKTVAGQIL